MNLKPIPVQLDDRFLSGDNVLKILKEINAERLVIAIDGPPASGKIYFGAHLRRIQAHRFTLLNYYGDMSRSLK